MAKYRKKSIVIDAIQFNSTDVSTHEHVNFGWPKEKGDTTPHRLDKKFWCKTPEGEYIVNNGDWIITDVKGEHYPCNPGIFELTYDLHIGE